MDEQRVDTRFRSGHAGGRDWRAALDAALAQMTPLPDGANIAFLYLTDHHADSAAAILDRVRRTTGIEACHGTAGFGVCASGGEYFDEPALALMVGRLPKGAFTLFERPDRCASGWFGVVHADPRFPALPETLADLGEASGAFLVGGLTASRRAQPQFAGGLVGGGVSGAMFSERVEVLTGLSQGCSPIGPAHRITECDGNVVVTLDERPAFEVLREEAGAAALADLARLGGTIMAALPVSGADRPDYLVRNLMGLDPKTGMIAIGAMVEAGELLMFCRRDAKSAAADLDRMLADLKRRAGGRSPRGGLYFSCVARGPNMFGAGGETRRIAAAFGDLPLAGFFCGGEISHARLYGYTGVLSLFM
jgi:small ligand-binding sensory domain FIST